MAMSVVRIYEAFLYATGLPK